MEKSYENVTIYSYGPVSGSVNLKIPPNCLIYLASIGASNGFLPTYSIGTDPSSNESIWILKHSVKAVYRTTKVSLW
nr:MAG TPA: hypothetical protein [Caudoviricetes sp.]